MTVLGTLQIRIARTRGQSFLPAELEEFQRRAPEVSLLIREAFLRGISTSQVMKEIMKAGKPVPDPAVCLGVYVGMFLVL